jgi:hypothetical protein
VRFIFESCLARLTLRLVLILIVAVLAGEPYAPHKRKTMLFVDPSSAVLLPSYRCGQGLSVRYFFHRHIFGAIRVGT